METKKIKLIIEKSLNDNKANNIVIIDLKKKKKSYIVDYMILHLVPPRDIYSHFQKIL